jgi:hypothetical protein
MNDCIFPRRNFSPEEMGRVLRAAAPLPPEPIDEPDYDTDGVRRIPRQQAIEERLGAISAFLAINAERKSSDLSPSKLAKRFHAIAAAADVLLEALGQSAEPPTHIERALGRIADAEAAEMGGFPHHPPLKWSGRFTDFWGRAQLRDNVAAVAQLRSWARRAENAAQAEPAASETETSDADALGFAPWDGDGITHAVDGILRIWTQVLGRDLNTGAVDGDGLAYGPLVEFSLACLGALGVTEGRGKPLGQDAVRGRIRRRLAAYKAERQKI